jgi:hypothetical protein
MDQTNGWVKRGEIMIRIVKEKRILEIIENPELDYNKGKYITIYPDTVAAVDNSSGDAWAEDFKDLRKAINWLNNKFEVTENNCKAWDGIKQIQNRFDKEVQS